MYTIMTNNNEKETMAQTSSCEDGLKGSDRFFLKKLKGLKRFF